MIRNFLIFSIIMAFAFNVSAQKKSDILIEFAKVKAVYVISKWAHPLSECYRHKTEIQINYSNVKMTIYYSKNSYYFSCKYSFTLNSNNYFSSLNVVSEGYSDFPCFSTCESISSLKSNINVYKGDNDVVRLVESILNKSLNTFSCKDYCLLGLNYYWKKEGYRKRYLL